MYNAYRDNGFHNFASTHIPEVVADGASDVISYGGSTVETARLRWRFPLLAKSGHIVPIQVVEHVWDGGRNVRTTYSAALFAALPEQLSASNMMTGIEVQFASRYRIEPVVGYLPTDVDNLAQVGLSYSVDPHTSSEHPHHAMLSDLTRQAVELAPQIKALGDTNGVCLLPMLF
jgi:hypothetical protein